MTWFELVNVAPSPCYLREGEVAGPRLQNHYGTLETAIAVAVATEKANSNKIDVAVVLGTPENSSVHRQRLDVQRVLK